MWITYQQSLMERGSLGKILLIIRYSISYLSCAVLTYLESLNGVPFSAASNRILIREWLLFLVLESGFEESICALPNKVKGRILSCMVYSLRSKLLECFDWNKNVKESVRNLQNCPTRM
jgi:hypothetical protein